MRVSWIGVLVATTACGGGAAPVAAPRNDAPPEAAATASVLARLDDFAAPPYPADDMIDRETYDYRVDHGEPVPATAAATFACDLAVLESLAIDWEGTTSAVPLGEAEVREGVRVYLERDWSDIAGLRPWTHWHFVRGLDDAERERLIEETVAWLSAHEIDGCD